MATLGWTSPKFFTYDVELSGGAPLDILDDIIWLSGAFTQCSSNGHSSSLVCLPWRQSLLAGIGNSGLYTRLSRDTQIVLVRAASYG